MSQFGVRSNKFATDTDFRAKSTFGVAKAAAALFVPITFLNLIQGNVMLFIICSYILIMLSLNVYYVINKRNHEHITVIGLMVPGMLFLSYVFNFNAIIASLWCFPTIVACYCMLSRRCAIYTNVLVLIVALPQAMLYLAPELATRLVVTLIAVSLFSSSLVHAIDQMYSRLQQRILHDPLTGLLNRLSMKDTFEDEVLRVQLSNQASTILAIDIDNFKTINDRFGHETGDLALTELSRILSSTLRSSDKAFRTGGEEFIVLLPEIDKKQANMIAERLRHAIETADIVSNESVTISIGVAQYRGGEHWQQWCKRADDRLYMAKRLGRNRVMISDNKGPSKVVSITRKNRLAAT